MIGALFVAAKLACIYVPDRRDCIPLPQIVTIAGAAPSPASYPLAQVRSRRLGRPIPPSEIS